mmetsp:Transcript_20037/g.33081  ORF Transcript_20037/g.33081 Transcript_20037/m.33081 type:complete len:101 (-) Transcript_20037:56-358(-)
MIDTNSGSRNDEREDQYYRELLARVDNAIVETRESSPDGCNLERCCKSCMEKCIAGSLFVAAIVTECCISLKLMVSKDSRSESVGTNNHFSSSGTGGVEL